MADDQSWNMWQNDTDSAADIRATQQHKITTDSAADTVVTVHGGNKQVTSGACTSLLACKSRVAVQSTAATFIINAKHAILLVASVMCSHKHASCILCLSVYVKTFPLLMTEAVGPTWWLLAPPLLLLLLLLRPASSRPLAAGASFSCC